MCCPPCAEALLNRATLGAQSGHLALAAGRTLAGRERGEARAGFLRGLLGQLPARRHSGQVSGAANEKETTGPRRAPRSAW